VKVSLARRISLLERRQDDGPRRIYIVTAADEPDRKRQMGELVEAGVIGARDGFLYLMGKPLVH
jgi:hypothetical protein